MKKGASVVACLRLLTINWAAATVQAQQNAAAGCGVLTTQYARDNARNLSLGISSDAQHTSVLPFLLTPRVSGTPGNARVRSVIKKRMRAAGWMVEEDSFLARTPYGNRNFTNVIATLNPGRPRRVILACHYDSKFIMFGLIPFVGATDSAVPCALLLDSATQLRQILVEKAAAAASAASGQTNDSGANSPTLQFVFFDGEEAFGRWSDEDSLYGSRHLAQKWDKMPDPVSPGLSYLQTIDVLILLDLIGTADTHFANRFIPTAGVYDKLRNIEMCLMWNGYLEPTSNFRLPLFTSIYDSKSISDDHMPFWKKGVPFVHLITSPFPRVWHTLQDNRLALDFQRINNLARILRLFMVDLLP